MSVRGAPVLQTGCKASPARRPLNKVAVKRSARQERSTTCYAHDHRRLQDLLQPDIVAKATASIAAVVLSAGVALTPASDAADAAKVGACLLKSCQTQLAGCLADPGCLQNLICLQNCNGRPDEQACQIRCGDLYEDKAVDTFNCCAVSDASCVPQAVTENAYPEPSLAVLDDKFDVSKFTGRWYITAGYNQLFDTFDCQEHFFDNPEPGKLYGKINWRISKPNGDWIQRSTIQKFVQDPEHPSMLANKGNEYLHYEDLWYIIDSVPDEYVYIYYKGNNDAWKGYGGATVYTREDKFPMEYEPKMRLASEAVGLKWDDFTITDNTCGPHPKRLALTNAVAAEFEKDLKSFGRGFTVLQSDIVNELTKEEKLVEKELSEAGKALMKLEKSYEEKGLFSFLKWPFGKDA